MDSVSLGLNAGAAITAFIAAVFWFISAAGKVPTPKETWATFLDTPREIVAAMKDSARWNRLAALFAGVSAALVSAANAWSIL
jgi:hypothetical protein